MKRISVLVLDEQERLRARALLHEAEDLTDFGSYIWARLSEAAMERLRSQTDLVFNEEPEPHSPEGTDEAAAIEALLSLAGPARLESSGRFVHQALTIYGPLDEAKHRWLESAGVTVLRKLGASSYLVELDDEGVAELRERSEWWDVHDYGAAATLDAPVPEPRLKRVDARHEGAEYGEDAGEEGKAAAPSAVADEERLYDASCHRDDWLPALEIFLREDGRAQAVQRGEDRVRFSVMADSEAERSLLLALGSMQEVALLERFIPPEPLLCYAVAALTGKTQPPLPALRWQGEGETIGIADSGIDAVHPDFAGRLQVVVRTPPLSARDPFAHGTHVASIAAGDGAASGGLLAGMAPKARLYFQSIADENGKFQVGVGIGPLIREAYEAGARIQNYSWGSSTDGRYTLDASALDRFVYEHPDLLVVLAAGNWGAQGDEDDGIGRNRFYSLGSPAAAKNCLTVGATCSPRPDGPYAGQKWREYDGARPPQRKKMADLPLTGDPGVVAALSSRGPSRDDRVKPDILAPGVGIAAALSADSGAPRHPCPEHPRYHFMSGTSMAAPLVAGAAALVREYLVKERQHRPSAALLKAILINGARWLPGNVWEDDQIGCPNFHQGFGRLALDLAMPLEEQADFELRFADVSNDAPEALRAGVSGADVWRKRISVPLQGPLSVTLAWTDPPGTGVQHQLDLLVVSPSGARHAGNAGLRKLGYQTSDRNNNVEQVRISDAEAGEWLINVVAFDTLGKQGFALAATLPTPQ
ncbi:S8 family serine peptidase [Sphingomonas sp. CCH5-D11]|uniref:S8 family serine peptidase n=1 Tax=Sphingomonas sp. CCH5-D11 TaxID=1768786 RepID=UPI00082E9316|nr:S8 family serine peptidase [Sphingomonas sp. CCH5-D11]